MNRSLALAALALLFAAGAALAIPCTPYPGNGDSDGIPDDQDSCIVQWNRSTPMSSSPLSLMMEAGTLAIRICDLEEPALNSSTTWCPERSGATVITLGEWCNRLRVLPLPAGGTEAMRAAVVTEACTRNGA